MTTSEANSREHWHVKAKRHTKQRAAITEKWKASPAPIASPETTPLLLYILRIAPRKLDSADNLPCSVKAILDEICSCILPGYADGQADGKLKLKVVYAQEKGLPKQYAIKIKLFILESASADLSDCEILQDTSHCICKACRSVVPLF